MKQWYEILNFNQVWARPIFDLDQCLAQTENSNKPNQVQVRLGHGLSKIFKPKPSPRPPKNLGPSLVMGMARPTLSPEKGVQSVIRGIAYSS